MGKPIIEHQGVAFMLADMAINVEAARGLVWKAAWAKDAGEKNSACDVHWARRSLTHHQLSTHQWRRRSRPRRPLRTQTSVCKVCPQTRSSGRLTFLVFGGAGFNTELPMEKLYRDAKIYELCTSLGSQ